MDLSKYKNGKSYINSVEEVDTLLSKLVEVENLKSGTSKLDFEKFDLEVRLLIRKVKVQLYFISKFQELRLHYPQQQVYLVPPKPVVRTEKSKPLYSDKMLTNNSIKHPAETFPTELGRRRPTGFITVIGETPKQKYEQPKVIEVYSKRATYQNFYSICRNCYSEKAHWHYADSNCGPVILCSSCKDKIFQKSHGGKSDTIFTVVNRYKKF